MKTELSSLDRGANLSLRHVQVLIEVMQARRNEQGDTENRFRTFFQRRFHGTSVEFAGITLLQGREAPYTV